MISPSLKLEVTKHIFIKHITTIFKGNEELIEFVLTKISTYAYPPEDLIIQ